jgi:hypothetical protein
MPCCLFIYKSIKTQAMSLSQSAERLKQIIESAIESHQITHTQYDNILQIASEDSFIDAQERALLAQLHNLIEDKTIKMVAD